MVLFGSSLNLFLLMCFRHSRWMQLIHECSSDIFDWITLWIGTIILSLILRIQRIKIYVGFYDVLVLILNLETCCSNFASLPVQQLLQACCSSSVISSEDQVCQNTGYYHTFWDIASAFFSSLWHHKTHYVSWLHLSFCGHWPYLFRSNNPIIVPGLMLVHLQPIPDAEYLPLYQWS